MHFQVHSLLAKLSSSWAIGWRVTVLRWHFGLRQPCILCPVGLAACFIGIREQKRDAFVAQPQGWHLIVATISGSSEASHQVQPTLQGRINSVAIGKWRFFGALWGTSSFLKPRHIWTHHTIKKLRDVHWWQRGASLWEEEGTTGLAMNFQCSPMLLSPAVVRETEISKCVLSCPSFSALATFLCHS